MARRTSRGSGSKLNVTGPRIRDIREKKGWSQLDLARRLQVKGWDIDPATLSRVETQKRSLTDAELLLIARVLRVSLQQFQ